MYGSLQVSSPSMYDITDSSECDGFSGEIVPKIAENRLGKHCHRSEESNDVSSFQTYHEEDGLLTVGKNTAALDLLVSAAMQVSSGLSFGDDETFRSRKRVERGVIQAGLDRCAELFLLHGKLSPAKKKVKRLVQHSSKKHSNVGIHSGKGQKRRAPDEDGAPEKHVPDTVHAKDRCPAKRRRFGVLPNNLPHSVIQTVQKVLRSEIPEVFPCDHFRRRKITKYCDEKYEDQERENKLKFEAAHAADMKEKEPVAQLKQCKFQGQPIKPTCGVLQSLQNVMRSGVASEIHFGRSNKIILIDNRGEDQETENTSDMPFLETTAQNKYSSVQVQDVADVKEGDPLVRSK